MNIDKKLLLNDPRSYIYIDEQGVLGLDAQFREFNENERSVTNTNEKGKKLNIGLSAKVKAMLFGEASLTTGAEQYDGNKEQLSVTQEKSIEQVIGSLQSNLMEGGYLRVFGSIEELLALNKGEVPVFCVGGFPFLLDLQYYLENDLAFAYEYNLGIMNRKSFLRSLKKEAIVSFHADLSGLSQNDFQWAKVSMAGSVEKWTKIYIEEDGTLRTGGSLNFGWRLLSSAESPFELGVLGRVSMINQGLYIKPYAIWDME